MKRTIVAFSFMLAAALAIADEVQSFVVRAWTFEVPSGFVREVRSGPDFTVTYFSSKDRRLTIGVYEGMHPQRLAKKKKITKTESVSIGGQATEWTMWEDEADGVRSFGAEAFLTIRPDTDRQDLFHVFVTAPSIEDRDALRFSIEKARRKKTAQPGATDNPGDAQ